MADFQKALAFTLVNEGGFVNNPNDPGGATNKGITISTLSDWLGIEASVDDVKNISNDVVSAIYGQNYWNPVAGDHLKSQAVATAIFDLGVNTGPTTSIRMAQACASIISGQRISIDGLMGPGSIAAINTIIDEEEFIMAFASSTLNHYVDLIRKNASLKVFLNGWRNRAFRYITLLDDPIYN